MIRKAPKRIYAALLLLILVAAYAGHKVHIYKEDPAHFAALCGDLLRASDHGGPLYRR